MNIIIFNTTIIIIIVIIIIIIIIITIIINLFIADLNIHQYKFQLYELKHVAHSRFKE